MGLSGISFTDKETYTNVKARVKGATLITTNGT